MNAKTLQPGTLIERYCLDSVLGRGGMATVYSARHTVLGSTHAVKVVHRSSRSWTSRVLREGRAQAQLRHPNIVGVTDVLEHEDMPVLVLEYVGGPPLNRLVSLRPLSLEQIDAVCKGVIAGVEAAHGWGFVHRDLKPQNILCDLHDDQLVPRVTDFGLVRDHSGELLEPRTTRSGQLMGTPGYMAPEQLEDASSVDARADVFSLAAVLYFVCTRVEPFIGPDDTVRLRALVQGDVPSPRSLRADLPVEWEQAILQALHPDREQRLQSVAELRRLWTRGSARVARSTGPLWPLPLLREVAGLGPGRVTPQHTPTEHSVLPDLAEPEPGAPLPHATAVPSRSSSRGPSLAVAGLLATLALVCAGGVGILGLGALSRGTATIEEPEETDVPSLTATEVELQPSPEEAAPEVEEPAGRISPRNERGSPTGPQQDRAADPTEAPELDPPEEAGDSAVTEAEVPAGDGLVDAAPPSTTLPPDTTEAPGQQAPSSELLVEGAPRAYLTDAAGKRWSPGPLPPGTYAVWVFFDEVNPTRVMRVDLSEGQHRTLSCNAGLRVCQ